MASSQIKKILIVFFISLVVWGCASDSKKVENLVAEAQNYYNNAEYQKAVIQLKNAIKINNGSIAAHTLLAKTYLKLGDAQETFKTYLRLEQLEPENASHKLQAAYSLALKAYCCIY